MDEHNAEELPEGHIQSGWVQNVVNWLRSATARREFSRRDRLILRGAVTAGRDGVFEDVKP